MPADLSEFMRRHAQRPWKWGETDCSLTLADWAIANGYPDPAPMWRGAYASEDEWMAVVIARGGLQYVVADVCARAGIPATDRPSRGVIGVIGAANNPGRQYAAIHDGAFWQVRLKDGFAGMKARALGMWRVA